MSTKNTQVSKPNEKKENKTKKQKKNVHMHNNNKKGRKQEVLNKPCIKVNRFYISYTDSCWGPIA